MGRTDPEAVGRTVKWLAMALAATSLACGKHSDDTLRVERSREPGGIRLTLIAKPSVKINAQLKPALELADGTVLRFDTPQITPDSAYFTANPELLLPPGVPARGIIRASVCDSGEAVCRLAKVSLR